jgi:hypothetical protein
MALWGYAVQGDILDASALLAEGHTEAGGRRSWDRTAADLTGEMVSHGDGAYRRVKDFAALPWVTEHVMRGHAEWPGL